MDNPVELDDGPAGETDAGDSEVDAGWQLDKRGKWYAPARGRSGLLRRVGNETLEEAYARDLADRESRGADRPPKPKPKTRSSVPKQPAPTTVTSIELEALLREVLSAPAMGAGMAGDQWAADHFTREAPVLARNLVAASEHNPWLRRKLEGLVLGEDLLVKLLTLLPVAGALIAYSIPPIIYYFDPPFIPREARQMMHVPDRREITAQRKREEELRAEAAHAAATAAAAAKAAAGAAA